MKKTILALALPLCGVLHAAGVENLRCEYLKDPLGVDAAKPRLGWILQDDERGQKQTAYQILVATSPEILAKDRGDLWDSGKVEGDQSIQVEYAGKPLESRQECHWKVRVWDKDGEASDWSQPALWRMGLLQPEDWTAKWIKPGVLPGQQPPAMVPQHPWLRRNFEVNGEVKGAKAYINTPCLYELYINGQKVGDDVLMPAYAHTHKRAFYNVYEVSHLLKKGTNCIALWMGPGWFQHSPGYSGPIVRAQLEIESPEGATIISTDDQWRTADSCITQLANWEFNNFGGERYDAGKYFNDWNLPTADDSAWARAVEVAAPNLTASWQALPGSRTDPPTTAKSITPFKGKWLIDFGTTFTGWMRLRLNGLKPGQQVHMEYADMIDLKLIFLKNGDGIQTNNQFDIYVAGDEPDGVFQSKFNHHAFRYVVVSGLDKAPELGDAQAMMVRTHLEPAGGFRCSNELFNRIHEITVRTCLTQSPMGVIGGGETREKQGYGNGGAFLTGWVYNFGSDAFFVKWLQDWRDNQREDGFFGNVAPTVKVNEGGGPSWGGQASELTTRLHLYYEDKKLPRDFYPALRKYVDYLESHTENDILRAFDPFNIQNPKQCGIWQFLGDWTPPVASPDNNPGDHMQQFGFETTEQREFFNNCYRVLLWQDLADFAGLAGDAAEQKRCQDRLAVLRPLIHKTYFDPEKNAYRVNRQAYLVIALRARIMPEELRPVVFKQLEDNIVVEKKGHLDCGLQGSYMLLDLLAQENRPDLAALIMGQETYPGWGFLVKERKVTTWPETWSGWGSQIIEVVGTPGAWFYEGFAGIRPDPAQPGFKHFSIRPGIVDSVDWVECWHDSPYGKIVSNWKREGEKLTMEVAIPPNSTGTIFVPAKDAASVTESGKPVGEAEGVKFLRMENNAAVYAVGSGSYQFQSKL